jgi:hypothetical protein
LGETKKDGRQGRIVVELRRGNEGRAMARNACRGRGSRQGEEWMMTKEEFLGRVRRVEDRMGGVCEVGDVGVTGGGESGERGGKRRQGGTQ